jgi:hypothetical protein
VSQAWRQLERFARANDVLWPAHVSPELTTQFVDDMVDRLSPKSINERLRKIRAVLVRYSHSILLAA